MAVQGANDLIRPDDPDPVITYGPSNENCVFLLIGDHAGNRIPQGLGALGLSTEDLNRHIALDIGVERLGIVMADRLGAAFVRQVYSRLVIDCNRMPGSADSIAAISDGCAIPANQGLSRAHEQARREAIFDPYHASIRDRLAAMRARAIMPILVSLHSFTPVMNGLRRAWDIGVLHDGANDRFAREVLAAIDSDGMITVGDNEPYRMDATDYTVPHHAFAADLPYVELEVRQDWLADRADTVAGILVAALRRASAAIAS